MLINAGGVDVPDERRAVRAGDARCSGQGSLLDPRFPASTIFGNQMCDEVIESIMLALADALPDRVTAGWNQLLCTTLAGIDPRTSAPSVSLSIFMRGGPGAMRGADGFDALGFSGTPGSMRSPDMEMFELSLAALHGAVRVPPRLGGRGRVARRPRHDLELALLRARRARRDDRRRRRQRGRRSRAGALRRRAGRAERAPARHCPTAPCGSGGRRRSCTASRPARSATPATAAGAATATRSRRDPRKVLAEVRDGLLSAEKARASYGVAVLRRRAGDRRGRDGAAPARLR